MRPKQIWRIDNVLIANAGAIILFIYYTSFALFLFRSLSPCVYDWMCVRAYVNRIGFCVNYYHLISKAAVMFCLQKNKALKPLKALKLLFLYRSLAQSFWTKKLIATLSQREQRATSTNTIGTFSRLFSGPKVALWKKWLHSNRIMPSARAFAPTSAQIRRQPIII